MVSRIADVLSCVHIAVATFDASGQCTYCSPLVVDLLGITPDNLAVFTETLSPDSAQRRDLARTFEAVRNGKQMPAFELCLQRPDRNESICTAEANMLGTGADVELAVILRDTSRELNLRSDMEQIGRLAALGQITAGVAHEFNNIITSVLGWTQIASQNTEPESVVSSALEIIEGNARRAKEIASRLLGVSRTTQDSYCSFSVVAAVEEVLRLLSWEMSNAGIQVVRSYRTEDLCWGDDNRVGQVFINIIRNAMDAMPDGGTLHIAVRRKGDQIETSFADTGPGMDQAVLDQIFDPFFTTKRLNDSATKGGSGLGLAICRDILEEHGGKIRVESAPDEGTRFAILLPLADHVSKLNGNGRDSRTSIPSGVCVLVADDEPDIGEMVRTSLELKGAHVLTVSSGEKAVALCRKNHFHAAFVDFSMPGLSGHRLGREMLAAQPDLPIIFMSGREVEMEPDVPIADFLKKPFDLDDVQRKLRQVLKSREDG